MMNIVGSAPCKLYVYLLQRLSSSISKTLRFILFHQLKDAISNSELQHRVEVTSAECLSICPRPCGIAVNTQVLGIPLVIRTEQSVEDILECLSLYLQSNDGLWLEMSARNHCVAVFWVGSTPWR